MKLKTDKCHLLNSGQKYEQVWADTGEDRIWETSNVKLLGIVIDNQLKFDRYVRNLCSKANNKLNVWTGMIKHLYPQKRRVVVIAFYKSQFRYFPLTWMFHSRQLGKRINRIYERALQLIYDDCNETFE